MQTMGSRNMMSEHEKNMAAGTRVHIFNTKTILGENVRFPRFQDAPFLKSGKPHEKNNDQDFFLHEVRDPPWLHHVTNFQVVRQTNSLRIS